VTEQQPNPSPAYYPASMASRNLPTRTGKNDWLNRWLAGEPFDKSIAEQQGFQATCFYAVVIYKAQALAGNPVTSSQQLTAALQSEVARRSIASPIFAGENGAVVSFHPVEDPQQTARLKTKTELLRNYLASRAPEGIILCGVGRPALGLEQLRQSFYEAEEAVAVSAAMNLQKQPTFFGNSSLFNLLRSKSADELRLFCNNWLVDLIDYDARQRSELLGTLRAYFANNGNTALTAQTLKIHRNTLAYRLNRIAEITRLDLEDADVRLNLHLALKALEVLGAPQAVC
jgi:PucR family transcriptional regulator, purine catabolism regulatory protein